MAILGLIPARGGSKGIPRKNIGLIAGKPLIAWTIEAALESNRIDRVVVTTDDSEIAEVARAHGADVPFLRPAELALDETPGIDPVLHAVDALPGFEAVVLLQPTSPLRTAHDIDAAIALADAEGGSNVVSVTQAKHVEWTFPMNPEGILEVGELDGTTRRQDLPVRFSLNGAIYAATIERLRQHRGFLIPGTLGYAMPAERSVDIDAPADWRLAELLLADRVR